MSKKILITPPPFIPVSRDSVAGIEQMTYTLGKYLHDAGYDVVTAAREDSEVHGTLLSTAPVEISSFDNADLERFGDVQMYFRDVVEDEIRTGGYDVVIDRFAGKSLVASVRNNGPKVICGLDMEPKYWLQPHVFAAYRDGFLSRKEDCFAPVARHVGERYIDELLGPGFWERMNTVYNGIVTENFPLQTEKQDYVLYLGRLVAGKAPHLAIEAAKASGHKIVVAGGNAPGNGDNQYGDGKYFNDYIRPHLGDVVELFGPADLEQKVDLMQNARALVFPSQHVETLGLVTIEAMACGTPVIAFNRSVGPIETIIHGKTGFLVNDGNELAEAIDNVGELDPEEIADHARTNFDYTIMGRGYVDLIESSGSGG